MTDPVTDSFVTVFTARGLSGSPCDEWSVRDLEQQLGVVFPAAYRAFLRIAGYECEALAGSHYSIDDDLADLQRAGERIASHEKVELPQDAFVFLVHQGFACHFFLTEDGEDPAVFQCVEGMGPIERVASHFSEWLLQELTRSESYREERSRGT
ncbi:SMI1/KNR4 family protein [Humisphaera borealis]|uniref:SMI1/KNR4 family protein n=1 Tax=Humisphaera borealis TaxID=2807512 RepID=A0A7M2X167_9BACT|nr:SMI1/KNR4 family protein [Humisphaera borealis]QOV90480.1 SMI1/KNR4 family protein [Humisphaera borealis]